MPLTLAPVAQETSTCSGCHQPITADPNDSHGQPMSSVVWRSGNGYGTCSGQPDLWHRPTGQHASRCTWLVACPEHQL